MKKRKKQRSVLLLSTFDGNVRAATCQREGEYVGARILIEDVWDETTRSKSAYLLRFERVCALEQSLNFYGGCCGYADAGGFYEIFSTKAKKKLLERNFERYREDWLLSGTYVYDKDDPHDGLNYRGFLERMLKKKRLKKYHLYLLESHSGGYLILAKKCKIRELPQEESED